MRLVRLIDACICAVPCVHTCCVGSRLPTAIVKFPQIKNMLAAGSAAGLSAAAVYTETFMYCCNVAYFVRKDLADNGVIDSFQEYGENVNLTLQNLVIIALMWRSVVVLNGTASATCERQTFAARPC